MHGNSRTIWQWAERPPQMEIARSSLCTSFDCSEDALVVAVDARVESALFTAAAMRTAV